MKLLEELKRQVAELGPLKRVWLTSFNLSIEFVETYLLPILVGETKLPTGRLDFEALQLELQERKIEIRIFADKRMIYRSDRKRTAIEVNAITPRQIGRFSDRSLFHPKVIYLEGQDGRAVLGAGSANLTVGGWGRNQEAMLFRSVATAEQSNQIKAFFKPLFAACSDVRPVSLGKEFWGDDAEWEFLHSFDRRTFLERLLPDGESPTQLAIWSPYFAADLPAFLSDLRESRQLPNLKIRIVPDLLDGGIIRTPWRDSLRQELDNGLLSFHPNDVKRHPRSELCHAKVWMTPAQLAIGSWNCTGPGSNILAPSPGGINPNNVEAGILLRQPARISSVLGKAIVIKPSHFASKAVLDDIKLEVPEELPFDIAVSFDWEQQTYTVGIDWVKPRQDGYVLKLPDVADRPIPARKKTPEAIEVPDPKHLLINHYFVVLNGANEVYQGFINQTGLLHRRAEGYASLDELLDSRIPNRSGNCTGGSTVLRGEIPDDDSDEALLLVPATLHSSSYFKLFQAMETFADEIASAKSAEQLERSLFARPGCLAELQEKIVLRSTGADGGANAGSVYQWFLELEGNRLSELAKKKYRQLTRTKAGGPRWKGLGLKPGAMPAGADPRYIDMIMKDRAYG
ncbi:hypothetical protein [Polaromonas hydrogenivorans]|uniref:Phospholipase D-like domain-containing protein n=1 Tax=Polaromonas hydrogenivorans TaxID=335476 RepID=A0AAU7LZZ8_9BURK